MAATRQRPGAVIVAAVLLFIFGSFAVIGGCCGLGSPLMEGALKELMKNAQGKGQEDPFAANRELDKALPIHRYLDGGFHFLHLLLGILKIVAGIGLLRLSNPCRVLTIITCVCSILVTLVQNAYTAIFVFPVLSRVMEQQMQNQPPMPINFGGVMQSSMWGGLIFGIIVSLAIWLTVIFLVSGASVRAAFAGKPTEDDRDEKKRSRYEGYEDDDDYPRSPPKSPGDTGITDRP